MYRDKLAEIRRLRSTGKLRDSDEAGELMRDLSQRLRGYLEQTTGVEQPKLKRNLFNAPVTNHNAPLSNVGNRRDKKL